MQVKLGDIMGKEVNTISGTRLGHLANVELEATTGNLLGLHIEPLPEVSRMAVGLDRNGRLRLPFQSIRSVKDIIMVEYDIANGDS